MRMLLSADDHFAFLQECVAAKPTKVVIASYGLYAGILPDGRDVCTWGEKYKSQTRDLLEAMRGLPSVQLLIGLYEYKSCKGTVPCTDCERLYVLNLVRHMNHAEKFPEFNWRVTTQSHVKCTIFTYPNDHLKGVAGSRNFTDSTWAEVTIELDKMSILRLEEHINAIWTTAKILTDEVLSEIMEKEGISQAAINKVIGV
jgi:hypothetical protein